MQQETCLHCKHLFPKTRKDRKFCSSSCRSLHAQKRTRAKRPANSRNSTTKCRTNMEIFHRVVLLTEIYTDLPVAERLGYLNDLIHRARNGCAKTREVLINDYLVQADDPKLRRLLRFYYVKRPIGQSADRFCRRFWNASVRDVITGRAPEPPTGEVLE